MSDQVFLGRAMTDGTNANILRRMAGMQDSGDRENPLTSSRAIRLALAKVAQDHAALPLTVSSVAEDVADLDPMLGDLPQGLMLVRLLRDDCVTGLIALDMELRASVLEMATAAALSAQPADPRSPTVTDRFLCDPLLKGFLDHFPDAVRGTSLDGWGDGVVAGDLLSDTRSAGLVLDDGRYRSVQMTVQLGQTDRQGVLVMVLPLPRVATVPAVAPAPVADWADTFAAAVGGAPAALQSQLHQFAMPLAVLRGLKVGTVLPLDGCSVASVRLRAQDGRVVARARLGQSGGKRAVRLETPPALDLQDLVPGSALGGPPEQIVSDADLQTALHATADEATADDPALRDTLA